MSYSSPQNLMSGPPMQGQGARPPYFHSQAAMVNGDGHNSYPTQAGYGHPGGQAPARLEQHQMKPQQPIQQGVRPQQPMQSQQPVQPQQPIQPQQPMQSRQFPSTQPPYYQQPPQSSSGGTQQTLNQPMANLQLAGGQQKPLQAIPSTGLPSSGHGQPSSGHGQPSSGHGQPSSGHGQPAMQPQHNAMGNYYPGNNPGPGTRSDQLPQISQFAPRMATGINPSTGVRPTNPQQYPGQVSRSPGPATMNGPNLNLSGPSVLRHPTGMPPHSASQDVPPASHSQPFSMANPGASQMPQAPGQRSYPPQPGASPMNLTGPMPPVGAPNAPSSQPVPGYGPGSTRPSPGGMPMSSPMSQQSRRIDPDQIPSPIQVMKQDQDNFQDAPFNTSIRGRVPPLITTKCVIRDDGNCSPRYMRSTLYNVPTNQDVLKASGVPFAVAVSPFAEIPGEESSLQLVDHGANGPVRCNRCKAYMNPFMQFIDGGRRFLCNICNYSSEVPQEYFSHLDHQGLRVDIYQRPELCLGSYEFIATADYCKNQKIPEPPAYIFMIEASYQSIQSGMLRMLVREIPALLERLPKTHGENDSSVKVGFVTYNSSLHFYNVKSNLSQPQMMIVSDVNDVFVPLLDGFLVNANEAKVVIESLMEQIPAIFAETRDTEIVLAPVVQAGLDALKSAGIAGKLLLFHTSLPISEAPGKLKNREDRKLLATEKEKTILSPQTNFYETLAKSCVEAGVAVDLFLFPNAYIDVATIGALTAISGGQLYKYSFFKEMTHGEQFKQDLIRNIERNVGLDTIMRLRTSTGLRPCDFYGNLHMNNTTDVELALVNSQTSIVVEIKHDDKLQEDSVAYLQCALLYTSISGQRRLRVHNLALSTCSQLTDLFRCCEMDTFTNYVAKHAIKQICTSVPKTMRENVISQAASILACYRQHCAAPSSAGQLILPECMKLLPLYSNSVLKSDALTGGSEISSDDRSWLMQAVLGMDIASTVSYFYPRLMPLHELNVSETTILPSQIRCSEDRIKENGAYLLENGIVLFMWIGLHMSADWLQQVFGVATIGHVDIEMTSLPELDTALSRRVRGIIAQIQDERQRYMKLSIVRQRDKLEPWFRHYLVEDKGLTTSSQSYVDFLCVMHKEVRNLLN